MINQELLKFMTAIEYLTAHPEIKLVKSASVLDQNEEIGVGADQFDEKILM